MDELNGILSNVSDKAFFYLQIYNKNQSIQLFPCVESMHIKKSCFYKLKISICEEIPLALWRDVGVITSKGDVFKTCIKPKDELPIFIGQISSSKEMLYKYFELLEKLEPFSIRVSELELDKHKGWFVILNNGIKLKLGEVDFNKRVNRFIFAYKVELHKYVEKIKYVDLQYPNGLAVCYKNDRLSFS